MPVADERVFSARELERFLRAVDWHLAQPQSLVVIGGAAAAIAYKVSQGTTDVDTYETPLEPLEPAFEQARLETGLGVPVSNPVVADVPYHYADRLVRVLNDLERLRVYALERHDLALSKAVRAEENDLAAMEELHRLQPLDEETLVGRYLAEMSHAMGDPARLDGNFRLLILRLFGEIARDRARKRLKAHPRRRSKPR